MKFIRLPRALWFVAGLIAVVAALLCWPAIQTVRWVGTTDLEVEFLVLDATTGAPIPGAVIDVHSDGGFYEERDPQDFALVTGSGGRARRLCRDTMCCGTSGWNIDTFAVYLPEWYYRVAAPGYRPTEETALQVPENARKVRRGKPAARLVVEVPLDKDRP